MLRISFIVTVIGCALALTASAAIVGNVVLHNQANDNSDAGGMLTTVSVRTSA